MSTHTSLCGRAGPRGTRWGNDRDVAPRIAIVEDDELLRESLSDTIGRIEGDELP